MADTVLVSCSSDMTDEMARVRSVLETHGLTILGVEHAHRLDRGAGLKALRDVTAYLAILGPDALDGSARKDGPTWRQSVFELEAAEAHRRGLVMRILVDDINLPLPMLTSLGLREHPKRGFRSRAELVREAHAFAQAVARGTRVDLTDHPPAERPKPVDAGVVVSDVEALLTWAERYVADEAHADDVRDEVDARRRQLRDEVRLIGQGRGSSSVLTGLSGALLALVRPEPSGQGLDATIDDVADAIVVLGEAAVGERAAAGEEVVAALDQVGEGIAEVIEANGWDDLKASMWRTAGAWVEEDFRPHLNAFITAARERALPAGTGAAGGAAVGVMGGPPWLAVTIVATGLLRSLFPWIFPRRTPPERPQPPEG